MPVSVAVPSGKTNESGLDKILKGLQIAQAVFKIPVDIEQMGALKQKNELEKAEGERKAAEFSQTTEQTARLNDATSQETQLTKAGANTFLQAMAKSELGQR